MTPIRQDFERLIETVKQLHKLSLEIADEELNAALAFFRPQHNPRRIPDHEDMMIYYLLSALRAFKNVPPIEPGDSPFEYRK